MMLGRKLTTLLRGDAVDRVVRVTLSPDPAADGDGGGLALDGLAVGVDVSDPELDGRVVLGVDEPVCRESVPSQVAPAELPSSLGPSRHPSPSKTRQELPVGDVHED